MYCQVPAEFIGECEILQVMGLDTEEAVQQASERARQVMKRKAGQEEAVDAPSKKPRKKAYAGRWWERGEGGGGRVEG